MLSNHLICLQSFTASGSFPMSRLFTSGGQSIRASASASVLPVNIQGWFPLGLTHLVSLQSKGLSRVFSNTTIRKHQSLGTQSSLWTNSHIHTWPLEKNIVWLCIDLCRQSAVSAFLTCSLCYSCRQAQSPLLDQNQQIATSGFTVKHLGFFCIRFLESKYNRTSWFQKF